MTTSELMLVSHKPAWSVHESDFMTRCLILNKINKML